MQKLLLVRRKQSTHSCPSKDVNRTELDSVLLTTHLRIMNSEHAVLQIRDTTS
jgi:hypothetical protein